MQTLSPVKVDEREIILDNYVVKFMAPGPIELIKKNENYSATAMDHLILN